MLSEVCTLAFKSATAFVPRGRIGLARDRVAQLFRPIDGPVLSQSRQ